MLARPYRLTRGSDYRLVVRRGSRCGGARVITSVLATGENRAARFGFIISKQVGTAVVRNTVRRRLKAVCAEALPRVLRARMSSSVPFLRPPARLSRISAPTSIAA